MKGDLTFETAAKETAAQAGELAHVGARVLRSRADRNPDLVESPVKRTFTLGNFFDIWGQPLSSNQVLQYSDGKPLRVFVNGKPYTGDPRAIELQAHTLIAL